MFKLLPQAGKIKAEREYKWRRASIILSLLSMISIYAIVVVIPSLVFVLEKNKAALFTLSSIEKIKVNTEKPSLETWVERTKQEISLLSPDPVQDKPYEYFQKILAVKPQGTVVTSMSWAKSTNSSSLKVRGIALNRQTLLLFQSKLNVSGEWGQVDFPVDIIAKETNIPFEISLTPKKIQ